MQNLFFVVFTVSLNSSLLNIAISGRARISSEYQNLDILTPLSKHAYTDAKWLPVFSKFLYDLIVFILYHFFFLESPGTQPSNPDLSIGKVSI